MLEGCSPIQRQVGKSQVHQPLCRSLEGFADACRHWVHFFRQRTGNTLHPFHQIGEGHGTGLSQRNAAQPGRTGGIAQACAAAVRAYVLPQEFFHPLHALLVLDLCQSVFHGVGGVEVGKVHVPRRAAGFVLVNDVFFHRRTVEHDVLFFVGQVPEGHVGAHTHLAGNVLHQRPHEGLPGSHRTLVYGQ